MVSFSMACFPSTSLYVTFWPKTPYRARKLRILSFFPGSFFVVLLANARDHEDCDHSLL
ncbi:hypothetical protein B0H10DRAFT_2055858 [Mycena sp. CBHHK59/15]|nr:hypothetical protein B0H10DRAFT_2137315 [Mycena sp. CBHHK59/15]KAJ6611624.1 hypothetical protein B0H10DRAFT_2055858 [Mycena sp. CBHHK59/15]